MTSVVSHAQRLPDQPFREFAFGHLLFGWFANAPRGDEKAFDQIRIHGFQGIGHDGMKALGLEFPMGRINKLSAGFKGETDSKLSGLPKARQFGQEVGNRLKFNSGRQFASPMLFGLSATEFWSKIGDRCGHEKDVVGRPACLEFSPKFLCGLEPDLLQMRRRIGADRCRAAEKGGLKPQFRGRGDDGEPHAAT